MESMFTGYMDDNWVPVFVPRATYSVVFFVSRALLTACHREDIEEIYLINAQINTKKNTKTLHLKSTTSLL